MCPWFIPQKTTYTSGFLLSYAVCRLALGKLRFIRAPWCTLGFGMIKAKAHVIILGDLNLIIRMQSWVTYVKVYEGSLTEEYQHLQVSMLDDV